MNWTRDLPSNDAAIRATRLGWWKSPKGRWSSQLALFSANLEPWVANPQWDQSVWHAWAIAILKQRDQSGTVMIIWDPDPHPTADITNSPQLTRRMKDILNTHQMGLIRDLDKLGQKPKQIFYNTDPQFSGQNKCLRFSMQWLVRAAQYGDQRFVAGQDINGRPHDSRVKGCIKIGGRP